MNSQHWNSLLSFDEQTGILECQAGCPLHEIIQVFIPRGRFLKTTSGTQFVTAAGAIASDVHRKNHHIDGCFSQQLISFTLLLGPNEIINCSRSENSDLFRATCGGMGLTGVILSAKFQQRPVNSSLINESIIKTNNLYYHQIRAKKSCRQSTYRSFFYPLGALENWSRLYGHKGFFQYQFVLPEETGVTGMEKMLSEIVRSQGGSFLAILKRTRFENGNPLSFPMQGYSLALDAQATERNFLLAKRLDNLLIELGGRIYLAKDALMSEQQQCNQNFNETLKHFQINATSAISCLHWLSNLYEQKSRGQ